MAEETMLVKWEKSKPYNLFFNKIPGLPTTLDQENSITFTDLLCPSLGKLKSSLQINFLVDLEWLVKQYKSMNLDPKLLTIIYGKLSKDTSFQSKPEVTRSQAMIRDLFGTQHSKIGINLYDDNYIRVVVLTANLTPEDWNNYNQGIWVSPPCRFLSEPSEDKGDSPTGFKKSLLTYFTNSCESFHFIEMRRWIEIIKKTDFSNIQVCLVSSVEGKDGESHWQNLQENLTQHCDLRNEESKSWDIIAQASSLGSLGKSPDDWLETTFLTSLASQIDLNEKPKLKIIFPSKTDVDCGFMSQDGANCLSYLSTNCKKQTWLKEYLHHWKADNYSRTQAMPHIKTYCRVSPCLRKLAWFLLTSANISKAAWGNKLNKEKKACRKNYEVGILFLPKFFGEKFFEIDCMENPKKFPLIYDLPLNQYQEADDPFCHDPNRSFH